MLNNLKNKQRTIIFIILFLLLIGLLFLGYNLFRNYSNLEKNKENDKPYVLKNNEILFNDYVYTLPDDWEKSTSYKGDGINIFNVSSTDGFVYTMGATIRLREISSTNHTKEELFSNLTILKNGLEKAGYENIDEGKIIKQGSITAVVFACNAESISKKLIAYMPAYGDYMYKIEFYSSKVIDDQEEMYLNYEKLPIILDFLNTGVRMEEKKESQ